MSDHHGKKPPVPHLNSGVLWPNSRRAGMTYDPEITGKAVIQCPHCEYVQRLWVNGWKRKGWRSEILIVNYRHHDFIWPREPTGVVADTLGGEERFEDEGVETGSSSHDASVVEEPKKSRRKG